MHVDFLGYDPAGLIGAAHGGDRLPIEIMAATNPVAHDGELLMLWTVPAASAQLEYSVRRSRESNAIELILQQAPQSMSSPTRRGQG